MNSQKLKKRIGFASAALLALVLMPSIAAAQYLSDVQSNGSLHLRGYGTFSIPGTAHFVDATSQAPGRQPGDSVINQLNVQFMLPQAQNGKKHAPIVFVHGGGLSSKSWQTTPDGRMGWDEYFVRQGFDTYLADQVSRARSGFDATKYNQVFNGALPPTGQAPILIPTDVLAWTAFRWGTTTCTVSPCYATDTPHPGIRFPMQTVGVGNGGSNLQFFDEVIPDLNATLSGAPSPADPAGFYNTPAQMAELANELGGAILVGHSESSSYPTRAALQPGSHGVKGIIQLETGCFGNLTAAEIATLAKIPIYIQYADFSAVPQPAAPCPTEISQITAAGGDINFGWVPHLVAGSLFKGSPGPITGNDHMIMLDNNNLQIADILIGWATSRGL
jgi:pimeloyl-ACP methyl ester carboxylesterase